MSEEVFYLFIYLCIQCFKFNLVVVHFSKIKWNISPIKSKQKIVIPLALATIILGRAMKTTLLRAAEKRGWGGGSFTARYL